MACWVYIICGVLGVHYLWRVGCTLFVACWVYIICGVLGVHYLWRVGCTLFVAWGCTLFVACGVYIICGVLGDWSYDRRRRDTLLQVQVERNGMVLGIIVLNSR